MKETIINRMHCTEAQAQKLEQKLSGISPLLQPVLEDWLQTGNEDSDLQVHGYSVNSLMQTYGISFTGALLSLDWLIREPEKAAAAIEKGIK